MRKAIVTKRSEWIPRKNFAFPFFFRERNINCCDMRTSSHTQNGEEQILISSDVLHAFHESIKAIRINTALISLAFVIERVTSTTRGRSPNNSSFSLSRNVLEFFRLLLRFDLWVSILFPSLSIGLFIVGSCLNERQIQQFVEKKKKVKSHKKRSERRRKKRIKLEVVWSFSFHRFDCVDEQREKEFQTR